MRDRDLPRAPPDPAAPFLGRRDGEPGGQDGGVFLAGLGVPLLFISPASICGMRAFFPWNETGAAFTLFAAYSMLVHCPREEIFWRGALTDPGVRLPVTMAGNGVFFYLLHGAAMGMALGRKGWLLAIPAGLAGGGWAFVTGRCRSLWPALVSHWAVDAAILSGMGHFLVKRWKDLRSGRMHGDFLIIATFPA